MAKVSFTSLKLKTKDEVKTIQIGEKEIEIKQYLSAEDKNSILESTIMEADHGTVLNTFAIDIYFHLFIVFKYTNLNFTDNQKEDLMKLYDILESNGIIEKIIAEIPEIEYKILYENLTEMIKLYNKYRNSARALVEQFSMFAPNTAAKLGEQIQDLDISKMQEILSLADFSGMNNMLQTGNLN
jgi:hypothetical protein